MGGGMQESADWCQSTLRLSGTRILQISWITLHRHLLHLLSINGLTESNNAHEDN